MEKGPRVVFKPDLEVQRSGDGGSTRLTSGGVVEGGRKEMTRDGSARGVSEGVGVGLYRARFNSNFELRSGKGFGPRCIVGRIGLKLSHGSGFGPRQSVGRQELQRGLFLMGWASQTMHSLIIRSWAVLKGIWTCLANPFLITQKDWASG